MSDVNPTVPYCKNGSWQDSWVKDSANYLGMTGVPYLWIWLDDWHGEYRKRIRGCSSRSNWYNFHNDLLWKILCMLVSCPHFFVFLRWFNTSSSFLNRTLVWKNIQNQGFSETTTSSIYTVFPTSLFDFLYNLEVYSVRGKGIDMILWV